MGLKDQRGEPKELERTEELLEREELGKATPESCV